MPPQKLIPVKNEHFVMWQQPRIFLSAKMSAIKVYILVTGQEILE